MERHIIVQATLHYKQYGAVRPHEASHGQGRVTRLMWPSRFKNGGGGSHAWPSSALGGLQEIHISLGEP